MSFGTFGTFGKSIDAEMDFPDLPSRQVMNESLRALSFIDTVNRLKEQIHSI